MPLEQVTTSIGFGFAVTPAIQVTNTPTSWPTEAASSSVKLFKQGALRGLLRNSHRHIKTIDGKPRMNPTSRLLSRIIALAIFLAIMLAILWISVAFLPETFWAHVREIGTWPMNAVVSRLLFPCYLVGASIFMTCFLYRLVFGFGDCVSASTRRQ